MASLQASMERYRAPSEDPTSENRTEIDTTNQQLQMRQDIYGSLAAIEQRLADGYAQAYADLADPYRVSWAGTAHEIRELIATCLRHLAPDNAVQQRSWYRSESQDGRPQKQRVKYILESRHAGSNEHEVTEQVDLIEERVGNLVRSTYGRASDAAHRGKRRSEARRILNYFEAFAHDLLDLP
jgi:hypothetical protein